MCKQLIAVVHYVRPCVQLCLASVRRLRPATVGLGAHMRPFVSVGQLTLVVASQVNRRVHIQTIALQVMLCLKLDSSHILGWCACLAPAWCALVIALVKIGVMTAVECRMPVDAQLYNR
jgi:hypothetical protein